MSEHDDRQKRGVTRHAAWLIAAAVGVYVTYIAYLFVYTNVN